MFGVVRPVVPVLAGVVLLELAIGALSPLIGLQLVRRQVATEVIGIVASAYFGGFLLGTVTGHRVIDRVGHVRAFSVFAIIAADAVLLHALIGEPMVWIGLRAMTGYALAGLFVIAESWLNDKTTADNRGRIFALYMAASWAASGVGPLGLNIPDPDGQMLFTLTAIVLGTALIPMALTKIGNPEIGHRSHFGVRRLYRISPLGVTACFGAGLINTALWGLLPVYTEGSGLSPARLSVLLSTSVIGALLVQFPVGMLSDRFGRRPLMLITATLGAGLAAAIVVVGGQSFTTLLVLTFLLGSMVAPLYALGVGQTNDYVSRKDFVAASSGLLFAWGLGASIGPAIAAAAMRPLGPNGLFIFLAAALAVIAAFVLVRMILRRGLSAAAQGNYVAVPMTQGTYGAPELDPRGEPVETHPAPAAAPED